MEGEAMSTARTSTGLRWAAKGAVAAIVTALLLAAAAMAGTSAHRAAHDRAGNSWSQLLDSGLSDISQ
jgi:hypothetical protein